jgi:L-cysteine S-thiosulfotransferase
MRVFQHLANPSGPRRVRAWVQRVVVIAVVLWGTVAPGAEALRPFLVVGDAIPKSLTGQAGDPQRGRLVVTGRELGNCLLCHRMPISEERFQGTIGPDLSGVATRLSEGQIRLRIVDASRLNSQTVMPPYYRVDGLQRVQAAYQGKPVLTAEQVEDSVAFLLTLH